MRSVLTIAGSDSSGGAGIQADLKTITVHGLYGSSAITALTAQNTLGVTAVQEVEPTFLAAQLDAIFTDIPPDAVKIGMVGSVPLIEVIAERLKHYKPKYIVLDPVMVATSGSPLIAEHAEEALKDLLVPIATIITPNLPEGERLSGKSVSTKEEMASVAAEIGQTYGTAVLLKGGHRLDDADDYLYTVEGGHWYTSERIDNPNAHGTGCTLSSALACNLAVDTDLPTAVERAKGYVTRALKANLNLGRGRGPLNHMVEPF
ncbi:MAG: bifunctional hydroxymethylpyrimidine kinase/phosphomethylpyrimidine kinase [Fastidiosipilaceae bacterium]|nr:bifunctional hydroxymethylpyrimidine kinase/phosphomethylpyrimidine kinase [Clostridiaceae bacterium]